MIEIISPRVPLAKIPLATRLGRRSRSSQRGSVMFVVVTTFALLSMMTLYAIKLTKEELVVAGYMRQATQTRYLSEYGASATAGEINGSTANAYAQLLRGDFDLGGTVRRATDCQSAGPQSASNLAKACVRFIDGVDQTTTVPTSIGSGALRRSWKTTTNSLPPLVSTWGPAKQKMIVWSEITNPMTLAPPPGYDTNYRFKFIKLTTTAGGYLDVNGGTQAPSVGRGRMVAGPVLAGGN